MANGLGLDGERARGEVRPLVGQHRESPVCSIPPREQPRLTSCPIEGGAFEVEWKCRLYADGAESGADRLACSAELHG